MTIIAAVVLFVLSSQNSIEEFGSRGFLLEVVDSDGPADPWGKSLGDIDLDGQLDIVVGGHASEDLVYYSSSELGRLTIATGYKFSTDHEIADLDGDGHVDIASLTRESLLIFYGPDWEPVEVDNSRLHDIEIIDLDNDGRLDLVGRNQGAFSDSGEKLLVFRNTGDRRWVGSEIKIVDGEGLAIDDINGDGFPDIVINQYWLENSGAADASTWTPHRYTNTWTWKNAVIATGDIGQTGSIGIVAAPAELEGQRYRISWFSSTGDPTALWSEHVIKENVEAVHHSLQVADMNADGRVDIVTAEMHQGEDPDEVSVFLNKGRGLDWFHEILGTQGSHGMRIGDLDNDGDFDLVGANWSGDDQSVYLWRNQTCSGQNPEWARRVIDSDQRWTSLLISSGDINGDGWQDIVSGAWWYENPGDSVRNWKRNRFSSDPFNAALLLDHDDDGDPDVFGTQGEGTTPSGVLLFGTNDGSGLFEIEEAGTVDGDFLQGAAVKNDSQSIILSWHRRDTELHELDFSSGIAEASVSPILGENSTQNEAISVADLNSNGSLDIILGTAWLSATESGYDLRNISITDLPPDRNVVADMDQDGLPDIIIGFESISKAGPIVWYRNPGVDGQQWRPTVVAEIIGPMSLDAGDIDMDGDIDLVAGEHNLTDPDQARLFFLENLDGKGAMWTQHIVYTGDEHHDGAQLTDIDNDGDLDILSIGWSHKKVLLYLNHINHCKQEGLERS